MCIVKCVAVLNARSACAHEMCKNTAAQLRLSEANTEKITQFDSESLPKPILVGQSYCLTLNTLLFKVYH